MAEMIPAHGPGAGMPHPLPRRYRLPAGPAAVAAARERVRVAIRDWELPVSADIAVLATGDLVTSLLTQGPAGPMTLGISGTHGRLRVDAYDGLGYRWGTPGLAIVASLADDWGRYRIPGGRAAYFTLLFAIPDTSVDSPDTSLD